MPTPILPQALPRRLRQINKHYHHLKLDIPTAQQAIHHHTMADESAASIGNAPPAVPGGTSELPGLHRSPSNVSNTNSQRFQLVMAVHTMEVATAKVRRGRERGRKKSLTTRVLALALALRAARLSHCPPRSLKSDRPPLSLSLTQTKPNTTNAIIRSPSP